MTTPDDDLPLSKTKRKQAMEELQALGEELVALASDQVKRIDIPDDLRSAVSEAQRMTKHDEARRRQMQYIGKLMRKLDADTVAAIEAALDVQHQGSAKDTLRLHQAEQWRDRLIAQDEALEAWLKLDPDADLQHLRTLVRQARKDASATPESAGAAPRHGKNYREIFQIVRTHLDAVAQAEQDAEDGLTDDDDHSD